MGQQARTVVTDLAKSPVDAKDPESQRQVATLAPDTAPESDGVPVQHELHASSKFTASAHEVKERGRAIEVASLVTLSALLHAGAAYGFYTTEPAQPERRLSKVDIEFVRPPEPEQPRPEPSKVESPKVEPPPPQVVQPKHTVKQAVIAEPEAAPAPQPSVSEATDTGIEAEASAEGNLQAGNGGTGVAEAPRPVVSPPQVAVTPPPIVQAHEGANYAKNPRPAYPARAKREGWQGKVVLRVQVLPTGRAGQVAIQTSAGRQMLDDAAQAAVRSWTFVPARRGGVAVAGWVNVPIEFRLK